MIKVAVVKKTDIKEADLAEKLCRELAKSGAVSLEFCDSPDEVARDANKALVFGGDGTVLDTANILVERGIDAAILGVNLGNLGFLTAFEKDVTAQELLNALLSDRVSELPVLDATCVTHIGYAINDVVVKSQGTRPIKLNLYIDGKFVDEYHGDGVIVSTATGSTAYSLSAGGPVLDPSLDALIINPICAHSLHSRPIVVSTSAVISIVPDEKSIAHVALDGVSYTALGVGGPALTVKKAQRKAKFVAVDSDFYTKLLNKMNSWGSTKK